MDFGIVRISFKALQGYSNKNGNLLLGISVMTMVFECKMFRDSIPKQDMTEYIFSYKQACY